MHIVYCIVVYTPGRPENGFILNVTTVVLSSICTISYIQSKRYIGIILKRRAGLDSERKTTIFSKARRIDLKTERKERVKTEKNYFSNSMLTSMNTNAKPLPVITEHFWPRKLGLFLFFQLELFECSFCQVENFYNFDDYYCR